LKVKKGIKKRLQGRDTKGKVNEQGKNARDPPPPTVRLRAGPDKGGTCEEIKQPRKISFGREPFSQSIAGTGEGKDPEERRARVRTVGGSGAGPSEVEGGHKVGLFC